MNAIQLLRQMHADTKLRFKLILGADDPRQALDQWRVLQSLLELHEQMEDDHLYTPVFQEMRPGNPLGDWTKQHELDVATVKQFIQTAEQLDPATPEWRTAIGTIMDLMNKHVTDEEGQIFGRIEQVWDPARLEHAGEQMQKMKDSAVPVARQRPAPAKPARRRRVETPAPVRRAH